MARIRRPNRRKRGYNPLYNRVNTGLLLHSKSFYVSVFLSLTLIQVVSLLMAGTLSNTVLDEYVGATPMERSLLVQDWEEDGADNESIGEVQGRRREEQHASESWEYSSDTTVVNEESIDDYYSRQHMPRSAKPILIIGGSDGSGTRAFVDTLGHLGVPMLVDDTGTMDVHASSMFHGEGWPSLVDLVMNVTHSADYEFDDLPASVQHKARHQMARFRQQYDDRAEQLVAKGVSEGKRLSEGIEYGFKAPVSMLLLPLLKEAYGSIKYLHVVRDGRDVAFSKNQSPVKKFYDTYYEDSKERRKTYDKTEGDSLKEAMGIQLWNDWNLEALEWERNHADGDSFDFLVMRTEDLMDPDKKLEALAQLSDFVGSQKTPKDLCCLSQQTAVDMGKSGVGARGLANLLDEDSGLSPDVSSRLSQMHQTLKKKRGDLPKVFEQLRTDHEEQQEGDQHLRGKKKTSDERTMDRRARLKTLIKENDHDEEEPSSSRRRLSVEDSSRHGRKQWNGDKSLVSRQKSEKVDNDLVALDKHRFGQAPLEAPSHNTNYLAEKEKLKRQEEKENEDLMLEESAPGQHAYRQVDKVKKKFANGFIQHDKISHKLSKPLSLSRESSDQVQKRYGRWASALEGRPGLSALLHSQGADALEAFGYEPIQTFMDTRTELNFQCDASVVCTE